MSAGKGDTLGTVQRVIEVLRHLAETGETTIKDTSAALGLVPSTCHRMLDLLTRDGLVQRDPATRGYRVGPEFFRIAALVQLRHDVRLLARPFMQQIVDASDETCVLCLYSPAEGHMVFSEVIDSSRLLRYRLPTNTPMPMLWGASGRSILAFLPNAEIERIYALSAPAPASGEAVPDIASLDADLSLIRKRGYAVSHGQKIAGAVGINAPVFDAAGKVIGCIGVTVPEQRIGTGDEAAPNAARLGELVRMHADALSCSLGAPKSRAPSSGARRA